MRRHLPAAGLMPSTARPKVVGAFVHGYPRPKVVLRTRGAMPPRKRAAHSKKLAGAKVAKVAKEENQVTIASVCLLLRHFFIHVTDNFCHVFCPFSQVVPWSSPAAPDFLSLLSPVSSLFCSVVLSLLSGGLPER